MMRVFRSRRGAMSTNAALGIIIALIVVSLGIFLFIQRPRQQREEAVKEKNIEEHVGKAGRVTKEEFVPDRKEGINLPAADQAQDGAADEPTTIRLPIEYGSDADFDRKIEARYKEIFRAVGGEEAAMKTRITIYPDRDLPYRVFRQAVYLAPKNGFEKLQVACLKKATADDVGYLNLDLPVRDLRVVFRIVRYEGDRYLYVLGTTKPKRTSKFEEVTRWLQQAASAPSRRPETSTETPPETTEGTEGAETSGGTEESPVETESPSVAVAGGQPVLIIVPAPEVTVQRFIDALNAGRFAGFKEIGIQ